MAGPHGAAAATPQMVVIGRISGVYGVRGWVKIFSHTSPRKNILSYSPWYLGGEGGWQEHELCGGHPQGRGVVAHIESYDDRDQAAALVGRTIAVRRDQLAELEADEYYWSDLEGLRVQTLDGTELGTVDHLLETGANDVLVVEGEREHLIPYVWEQVIKGVDLDAGLILVDWDPDF